MSDYISREAALEKVIEVKHRDPELSGVVWHRYIRESDLKDIPAADVVEVVRCEYCKHLLRDLTARKHHMCMRLRFPQIVNLDDFCRHGERSNNELDKR